MFLLPRLYICVHINYLVFLPTTCDFNKKYEPYLMLLCLVEQVPKVYILKGDTFSCRDADSVMDSVEFLLQNFTEMNKLWVRLQYQVH